VAIAELLDLVDRTCTVAGPGTPRDRVLVRHPLQPWSRRYRTGDDPRLFTYARGDAAGTPQAPGPVPAFVAAPVAPPPELLGAELPFERLADFWHHPCRFFTREVLGLRFPRDADEELETEPFEISALDRWRLQDPIVRAAWRGEPPTDDPLAAARATGRVPPGGLGAFAFAPVHEETDTFLRRVLPYAADGRAVLRVVHDGVLVFGEIDGLGEEFAVRARIARLKPKDRMRAWLQHVFVGVARADGMSALPPRTRLFAKDFTVTFHPLDGAAARAMLGTFLRGYREGLTAPLPLFDKSSYAFAQADDDAAGRQKAQGEWLPNDGDFGGPNDCEDDSIDLCMRGHDALALPGFAAWARAIWEPYRACTQETKA
jgi:exodeoxyribonuclease V gamma subunit